MKFLMPVLALCLFFAPVAQATEAEIALEAGPIWSQSDAEQKCPQAATEWQRNNQGYQARWNGHWWTTVDSAMSVCALVVSSASGGVPGQEASFDLEAGPLWDQAHAERRCSEAVAQWSEKNPAYEARWNGQWATTVPDSMSVCGANIRPKAGGAPAQAKPAEKKEPASPAKAAGDLPAWAGEFCNPKGCLKIGNYRQGPESFFFSFSFVVDNKEVGEGTAAVDGRNAGFADLVFSLKMSDNIVQVSKAPDTQPNPEEPWTAGCLGTYMRK